MTSVQTNIFLHFPPCLPSCTYVKLVCVALTNSGATFHAQSRLLDIFSVFLGERRCCLTSGEDSGVRQVGCINAARNQSQCPCVVSVRHRVCSCLTPSVPACTRVHFHNASCKSKNVICARSTHTRKKKQVM